jgi:hypothetical protein
MLGRRNTCSCRECGKTKPGNYFISPTLCKRCAVKRRVRLPNPLVQSTDGIVLTNRSLQRLKKIAETEVTITFRYWIGSPVLFLAAIAGMWGAWKFAHVYGPQIGLGWAPIGAAAVCLLCILAGAGRQKLARRTGELVKRRKADLEETERFYSSPEWWIARKANIKQQGRLSVTCRVAIRRDTDLTVDHIKPRSKFPHLALEISNLQVTCRACNSRKGARYEDEAMGLK